MRTMTITELGKNLASVMEAVENQHDEVVVMRERKPVARLVPEPDEQDAFEILNDLGGGLDEASAADLVEAIDQGKKSGRGTLTELRDP